VDHSIAFVAVASSDTGVDSLGGGDGLEDEVVNVTGVGWTYASWVVAHRGAVCRSSTRSTDGGLRL